MKSFIPVFLSLFLCLACGEEEIPIPPSDDEMEPMEDGVVSVWRTDRNGSLKMAKTPQDLAFTTMEQGEVSIVFDETKVRQEIDGFGAALTGSSVHVLTTDMDDNQRASLLKELFDPVEGIGIKYLRLTIGASDFSLADYTYNDQPPGQTDPTQSEFSLGFDQQDMIPLLQQILAINPDLKIMGTPWSAPAWMKDNNNLRNGGSLQSSFYASYALYFVRYVEAMADAGIPIHAITMQNEPLVATAYPSMEVSPEQQIIFIRDHLGPAFEAANINTKIIVYDHNWDRPDYPLTVLADAGARQYIAGSAFHCYAGDKGVMQEVQNAYPEKGIYFTECSGGDFAPDFAENLSWNSRNLIIGAVRNSAKTVLLWNLALDQTSGPINGGCSDCRGVVTVNSGNGAVTRNVEYYLLAHAGKFVQRGAVRIETPNTEGQGIHQVAFLNPDNSRVVLAFNSDSNEKRFQVVDNGESFVYTMAGGMLVTFVWEK